MCPYILTEKWKYRYDKKDYLGGVLMNLFKVFNKINYELLIAKLQHVASEKTSLHWYLATK